MKNSLAVIVGAATLALVVAPSKASAQVNIYVSPGGYAHYGYAYPHYGYPGYGYYGGYWGHGRRVARRVWRRRERWGW